MASDDYNSASADKLYQRVYPLNQKQFDLSAGSTVEPADGEVESLPETGKEFYFVIGKDGQGEIVAANPESMANEFTGDYIELSAETLGTQFSALQSLIEGHADLLSHLPSDEAGRFDPSLIDLENMQNSIVNVQSRIDELSPQAVMAETTDIVQGHETAGQESGGAFTGLQAELNELRDIIDLIEEIAPLIKDSQALTGLIHENAAAMNAGMTADQATGLQNSMFGAEAAEGGHQPLPFMMNK